MSTALPPTALPSPLSRSLTRYRIAAYVTGTALLVLVFVAVPLKYFADSGGMVRWVGQLHGFLFIAYLALAFDFGLRARWPLWRVLVVLVAGTVPFLSFVTERWATHELRSRRQVTDETLITGG